MEPLSPFGAEKAVRRPDPAGGEDALRLGTVGHEPPVGVHPAWPTEVSGGRSAGRSLVL